MNDFEASSVNEGEGEDLTELRVDIDHLGSLNHDHGWQTGDAVVSQVREVLRSRWPDLHWRRYMGDKFDTTLRRSFDQAIALAEEVRQAVADSFDGQTVGATVSVGTVTVPGGCSMTPLDLAIAVEEQVARAKRAGRNRTSSVAVHAAGCFCNRNV